MATVLYDVSLDNRFISIDRDALAERFEVVDYIQEGVLPRPLELWAKLRRCDVVYGWFATWHTMVALALAALLGKPSVLVVGGSTRRTCRRSATARGRAHV